MRYERLGPDSKLWQKWDPRLENWAIVYAPREKASVPARKVYEDLEDWRYHVDDFGKRKKEGQAATWEMSEPLGIYSEATAVRDLVLRLDLELELALVAWYWWIGPVSTRASQLRPPIHPDTLRNRVGYAIQDLELLEGAKARGEFLPIARKQQAEIPG